MMDFRIHRCHTLPMSQSGKHDLRFEDGGFIALVLVVSLAFAWLMAPFFGAILWGLVAAILFEPVNRRLVRACKGRRNLAAVITLLLIIAVAVLPALLIAFSLVQEALGIYEQVQSGKLDFVAMVQNLQTALPAWVQRGPLFELLPDIEELKASPVSLMPESFAKSLSPQDVADILAWLRNPGGR